MESKRILVAPLDWGLGHATRCIPIIRELYNQKAGVIIGSSGGALKLLQHEFPAAEFIELSGYEIAYRESGSFARAIIPQIPKIIRSGFSENKRLKRIISEKKINGVISDNRFGLFSRQATCAFITHQVGIIMPPSFKWAENMVYRLNYHIMKKFDFCWIPDFEGADNLSGILSHRYPLPPRSQFIGPLTRFTAGNKQEIKNDLLIVLSGPEPQRTVLEQKLLQQLSDIHLRVMMVRGTPGNETELNTPPHIKTVSHLNAGELNRAMLQSRYVVSRSGYSTIMDLSVTGKKAMLIPTPGQTEQEYLGKYFHARGIFYCAPQSSFTLKHALTELENFSGLELNSSSGMLTRALQDFLAKC